MPACIPDILDWTEIKKFRAAVAEGELEDGFGSTIGFREEKDVVVARWVCARTRA